MSMSSSVRSQNFFVKSVCAFLAKLAAVPDAPARKTVALKVADSLSWFLCTKTEGSGRDDGGGGGGGVRALFLSFRFI